MQENPWLTENIWLLLKKLIKKILNKWLNFSGLQLQQKTVHTKNHFEISGGIEGTKENLRTAINGKTEEFTEYPKFIAEAKAKKNEKALWTFNVANKVEKKHILLYINALENLGKNSEVDYYVCSFCGNTVEKMAPEKCSVCGASLSEFMKID